MGMIESTKEVEDKMKGSDTTQLVYLVSLPKYIKQWCPIKNINKKNLKEKLDHNILPPTAARPLNSQEVICYHWL